MARSLINQRVGGGGLFRFQRLETLKDLAYGFAALFHLKERWIAWCTNRDSGRYCFGLCNSFAVLYLRFVSIAFRFFVLEYREIGP